MFESGTKFVQSFLRDDSAATAIEYGLIAATISAGIIVVVTAVNVSLQTTFSGIANAFTVILAG